MSPRAGRRHWLLKSSPASYSIEDLERDGVTGWDGVRNYQARNLIRDELSVGDPVLYYHSNADPMGVVGLAEVASLPRPDETAFDKRDHHYDPKSKPEDPAWFLVNVRHVQTFDVPVTRADLASEAALADMMVMRRGARLSVQPVTPAEYRAVLALAARLAKTGASGRAPAAKSAEARKRK